MPDLEVQGKYRIKERELGRGAWSVVRPCEAVPPYQPPNMTTQVLFPSGAGKKISAPTDSASSIDLVAKVISKAHVQSLAGGNATRAREDVMREIDTLRVLPPHPNVVRYIEHLEDDDHYFIIFEAAPKGDLCDLILNSENSRIPETRAKQFTVEIVRAVLHCHRHGTAHRDIKPENLLVGHGDVLKLTDFGLAKVLKPPAGSTGATGGDARTQAGSPNGTGQNGGTSEPASPTTQNERRQYDFLAAAADPVTAAMYPARLWADGDASSRAVATSSSNKPSAGLAAVQAAVANGTVAPANPRDRAPFCPGHEIVGTLRYGAPEMFQAKFERGTFDAFTADVWSVGVVVYIMLTGNFPFSAGSNATERDTYKVLLDTQVSPPKDMLSAEARDFLLRLLNKNPDKRISLSEALDHPWLRETAQRNDQVARDAFRLRQTAPDSVSAASMSGIVGGLTAPPPVPLPPAVMRLRLLLDDAADKLPSGEADQLRAAFDDVVTAVDVMSTAGSRLREQILLLQTAVAAASAGGTSSGRSVSAASARSSAAAGGSARRVTGSPAPSTRGASASRPRDPSTGRSATPTGATSASAVKRPPSPSVVRRAVATTPGGRVPSPGRPAGPSATVAPGSSGTGRSGALTPTRRVAAGPAPAAVVSSGTKRTATPTGVPRRAESPAAGGVARRGDSGTGGSRTSSAARPAAPAPSGPAARHPSPLARAAPVATRSTPLRRPGAPAAAVVATGAAGSSARRPAPAPPTSSSVSAQSPLASSQQRLPAVGDTMVYKEHRAIVRFVGETSFATGKWVGLEMLEGGDGIHDGTSSVDKRRYYTCPNGRGIFVRPSQLQATE